MLQGQLILSTAPAGLILHIGAGLCDALDVYLDAEPDKIVLLEPNPELFAELTQKIQTHENINLITSAISETDGRAPLQVLNFAALSSLRKPTGLIHLLPGVRVVSEPMVDTIRFDRLCQQLPDVAAEKTNWLIIEAPGEELAIAQALIDTNNAKMFQNIIIRCGETAGYEGSSAAPEVLQALYNGGYQLGNTWVGDDPDWPYFYLRLDVVSLENARMKAALSTLETKLAKANTTLAHEKKGFFTQLQKQKEALTKNLEVALRLQMLARSDHQDLQTRYSNLQDEKRLQEELLIKLTQKLSSAAGHLRQLSDQETTPKTQVDPLEHIEKTPIRKSPAQTKRKRKPR